MSNLRREDRGRSGERGFTLIELLVVVTIIGILAAIVSVSVGGFTGKASVQAHKTTLNSVQAAVDAYTSDHYTGTGAVDAPTRSTAATIAVGGLTDWYDTDGVVQASNGATTVVRLVLMEALTEVRTSTLANTTRTFGPYLRPNQNQGTVACAYLNLAGNDGTADGQYRVVLCTDRANSQ